MLPAFGCLRGKKTLLYPFHRDDITDAYIGWLNDPLVTRYSNQRFLKHTYDSCLSYLSSFEKTDSLFVKIVEDESLRMIGTMTAYACSRHRTVDVGLLIGDPAVWGRGFGQDAWNTLLVWLGSVPAVRKVTGGTIRSNSAMIRIMERSGMALEAIRPGQQLLDGIPEDVLYFGRFFHTS